METDYFVSRESAMFAGAARVSTRQNKATASTAIRTYRKSGLKTRLSRQYPGEHV